MPVFPFVVPALLTEARGRLLALVAVLAVATGCYDRETHMREMGGSMCRVMTECFPEDDTFASEAECRAELEDTSFLGTDADWYADCEFDPEAARLCDEAYAQISCEAFRSGEWDWHPACDAVYDCSVRGEAAF